MKHNCKKCDEDFIPQKGLVNYCSLACRNSKTFSEESKSKKSESQKAYYNSLSDELKAEYYARRKLSFSKYQTKEWFDKVKEVNLAKYNAKTWDELSRDLKRRRVIEEQEEKCLNCGLSEWLGIKLTLELDHINGINTDDSRKNLRCLCPNCHSVTPTWRGRNKPVGNGIVKVTDEQLYKALISSTNIRQALLSVGLAAKGNNYERAKTLLQHGMLA